MFTVPAEQVECDTPRKGDVVTFSYECYSRKAIPVKPTITRIRTDMQWEEVLDNSSKEVPAAQQLNGMGAWMRTRERRER